jgi:hypothetical protein
MCIFGGNRSVAPPPPLPPAPPPPLPPTPATPPPDPVIKDVNPQVKEAMDKKGKKTGAENAKGTGDLKIKLKPAVNTGSTGTMGGGGVN